MSLHQILETLIHHTTFKTENEHHQILDLLDSTVDHDEPTDTSLARTDWKIKPRLDASGQPIIVPTAMTSAQADELISLLKAQQAPPPMPAVDAPPEPTPPLVDPSPLPPVVSTADVPPELASSPTNVVLGDPLPPPPVSTADVPPGVT